MAIYVIEFGEGLVVETLERYRAQRHRRLSRIAVKIVCFAGLAFLLTICVWAKVFLLAGLIGAFMALLLLGPHLDYWIIKRRLRKSPYYQKKIRWELQGSGLVIRSDISKSELTWAALTHAIRMRDGFLVFGGPHQFHWWPDKALVEGTIADVEALLRLKVAM